MVVEPIGVRDAVDKEPVQRLVRVRGNRLGRCGQRALFSEMNETALPDRGGMTLRDFTGRSWRHRRLTRMRAHRPGAGREVNEGRRR